MITVKHLRSDMTDYPPLTNDKPVNMALIHMIFYEIGYGASVQKITRDTIVLHTPILGHYDIVTISGDMKEMGPLVVAAASLSQISEAQHAKMVTSAANILVERKMNTLMMVGLGPMMVGTPRALVAMIGALEFLGKITCVKQLPLLLDLWKRGVRDFEAAMELVLEGESLEEVAAL